MLYLPAVTLVEFVVWKKQDTSKKTHVADYRTTTHLLHLTNETFTMICWSEPKFGRREIFHIVHNGSKLKAEPQEKNMYFFNGEDSLAGIVGDSRWESLHLVLAGQNLNVYFKLGWVPCIVNR